jgi:hypothetical protein
VTPDAKSDELERFWSALAKDLAAPTPTRLPRDPHEPMTSRTSGRAQARLAKAIARRPNHTIIATGEDWGNISGLLKLEPLADSNVIYSFHYLRAPQLHPPRRHLGLGSVGNS